MVALAVHVISFYQEHYLYFLFFQFGNIKHHPVVVKALPGVIAATCGLVIAAAYLMFLPVGLNWIEEGKFHYTTLLSADAINYFEILIIANVEVLLY